MEISECCKQVNPCDALCLLNNVMIDLVAGKFVTRYQVGGESFNFSRPTLAEVKALYEHFQKQCNLLQGKPSKKRAKICFVFGEHTCGQPTQKSGCR